MNNVLSGMIAGFAATVVLSLMMVIKKMMGVLPELDVIHMLAGTLGVSVEVGWIAHFAIGVLAWGAGFALLDGAIPGSSQLIKGIVFGIAAWLLMMVAAMPMAGAGPFGLGIGVMAPLMTFVLHIVFGAVLGKVYAMSSTTTLVERGVAE